MTTQFSPPAPRTSGAKTTILGVLGVLFGLLLWPVGVLFAVLSMNEARRAGRSAGLAVFAFIVSVFSLVVDIYYFASRR